MKRDKSNRVYWFQTRQARIQEFSSGGVQPSEKISISKKKKKKKTTRGEGGRFSIYSALVWSKCSIVKYVSDVTVWGGGVWGSSPRKCLVYMVSNRVILDKIKMEMHFHESQG